MPIREDLIPILEALVARIVPADQDPGARELGAVGFIQARIGEGPELQAIYEAGLQALAEGGFLGLSDAEQDENLREVDRLNPNFLSIATTHCIEAVYVQPEGFRMVGFEVTV